MNRITPEMIRSAMAKIGDRVTLIRGKFAETVDGKLCICPLTALWLVRKRYEGERDNVAESMQRSRTRVARWVRTTYGEYGCGFVNAWDDVSMLHDFPLDGVPLADEYFAGKADGAACYREIFLGGDK
jgi:hypothetical protein